MGCMVSLNDLADRPPRPLADGEVIELGGKRVRHIDTPHVPHGWDARVLYEETEHVAVQRPVQQRQQQSGAVHRRPSRPGRR